MKTFLAFALTVAVVAPFGQCQTFRRVPTKDGSVGWELKWEDGHVGGYQYGAVPYNTHKVAASGFGQTIGKTYKPVTFYNTPTTTYDKPAYGVVPKVTIPHGLVHKTHYQPRYQPSYHRAIRTQEEYDVNTDLHSGKYVPGVYKEEYEGAHHYGKVSLEGMHPPDYERQGHYDHHYQY